MVVIIEMGRYIERERTSASGISIANSSSIARVSCRNMRKRNFVKFVHRIAHKRDGRVSVRERVCVCVYVCVRERERELETEGGSACVHK